MVKDDLMRRMGRCLNRTVLDPQAREAYRFWLPKLLQQEPSDPDWVETAVATVSLKSENPLRSKRMAANALAFWFHCMALSEPAWFGGWSHAYRPAPPCLLRPDQAVDLIRHLNGIQKVACQIMLETGLRPEEVVALRVCDICFAERAISVAGEDASPIRIVHMPQSLTGQLRSLLCEVRILHQWDCAKGGGWAPVPPEWELSKPGAGREFAFQFLFPQPACIAEAVTRERQRKPLTVAQLSHAIREVVNRLKLPSSVSCYTLRHTYANSLAATGWSVSRLQGHLGQNWTLDTLGYFGGVEAASPRCTAQAS